MNHAVNLSKPKIIFVSPSNVKKIVALTKKHSFIEKIILYDNANDTSLNQMGMPTLMSFTEILETDIKSNDFKCKPQNMKENVATILCSSGTTGYYSFF